MDSLQGHMPHINYCIFLFSSILVCVCKLDMKSHIDYIHIHHMLDGLKKKSFLNLYGDMAVYFTFQNTGVFQK